MTISIEKTEAEAALTRHFSEFGSGLPGNAAVAELRKSAIDTFNQQGLPHRRIEEWKYTDLRSNLQTAFAPMVAPAVSVDRKSVDEKLGALAGIDAVCLIFIDGKFSAGLSDASASGGDGLQFMPISEALNDQCFADAHGKPNPIIDTASVGALNTAFMSDGAALVISSSPAKPIHIVHVATGAQPAAITTRHIVSVAAGLTATLIESHVSLGAQAAQVNALTHLGIGAKAKVAHIKVQREAEVSTHLSQWLIDLETESIYQGFQYSEGASLARNDININFKGANASADVSGIDLLYGKQHCDTTMVIDHAEPGCESRELFKFVLDNQARGVFQGKVVVHQRAQKTDGKQMAQALMLSQDCEFDSKPELEIYADDVACGHGSTCAEIDPDLIFYCRSRGIPEATARALLIESFVAEAIEKIENERIAEALSDTAGNWLARLNT